MKASELSKEIGARYSIPAWDEELRRELEARGFVLEHGTQQTYVMRRDFSDGYLRTNQRKPYESLSA